MLEVRRDLPDRPGEEPVDRWYYHWLTCEASRDLIAGRAASLGSVTVELELAALGGSRLLRRQFRAAVELRHRMSAERQELVTLRFRHGIVEDFRRLHEVDAADPVPVMAVKPRVGVPSVPTLDTHLWREYELHAGPVRMFIAVMHDALERSERDVHALIELTNMPNMPYNTAIQEALQRLQWVAPIATVASLVLGSSLSGG